MDSDVIESRTEQGHARQLPVDFVIDRLTTPLCPIKIPDASLQVNFQTFTGAFVFFLDEEVAVKAQTQRYIPDVELPLHGMLLELSLANFVGRGMERELFERLRSDPHPNLVRELDVGHLEIGFFERLVPLRDVWGQAGKPRRHRWACELASAVAHLEHMGCMPVEVHVGDLGVDKTGRLKLVGFGASPRRPSLEDGAELGLVAGPATNTHPIPPNERYWYDLQRAHQRLACCLHYVLSGINPDDDPRPASWNDPTVIVSPEEHTISPDAAVIAEILHRAWSLGTGKDTLATVAEKVHRALDTFDVEEESELPLTDDYYQSLQPKCRAWLAAQEPDPRWIGSMDDYEAACEAAGY